MKGLELPNRADLMYLVHGFEDDFDHVASANKKGFLNLPMGGWQLATGVALADFADGATWATRITP